MVTEQSCENENTVPPTSLFYRLIIVQTLAADALGTHLSMLCYGLFLFLVQISISLRVLDLKVQGTA